MSKLKLKLKQVLGSPLFGVGALAFASSSVISHAPPVRAENAEFRTLVRACLNQRFGESDSNGTYKPFPYLDKLDTVGDREFLGIPCFAEPAEKLFDYLNPSRWNKEGITVRESKSLERTERLFGIGGHWGANPSRCWIDRQGAAVCAIGLDVHEELTVEMKDAGSPFRRAFRGCIAQTVMEYGFVTNLYETPFSELVLTLDCEGAPARKLYDSLPQELNERVPHWAGTFRYFQGEHTGTQATRCSLSDKGAATCQIFFNLSYALLR